MQNNLYQNGLQNAQALQFLNNQTTGSNGSFGFSATVGGQNLQFEQNGIIQQSGLQVTNIQNPQNNEIISNPIITATTTSTTAPTIENTTYRTSQYCLSLADHYLKLKPAQPRFALQALTAALHDPEILLSEKCLINLRFSQLYYKYTENFNHVLEHLELAIYFGNQLIDQLNAKFDPGSNFRLEHPELFQPHTLVNADGSNSTIGNLNYSPHLLNEIYGNNSIIRVCPVIAYAESVLLQSIISLPSNIVTNFTHYQNFSETTKKSIQSCLNQLAQAANWTGPEITEWQVRLAFQMGNILYREAEFKTASSFIDYAIDMAKTQDKLVYYVMILNLSKSMLYLNQYSQSCSDREDESENNNHNGQKNEDFSKKTRFDRDLQGIEMVQNVENLLNENAGSVQLIPEVQRTHLYIYVYWFGGLVPTLSRRLRVLY